MTKAEQARAAAWLGFRRPESANRAAYPGQNWTVTLLVVEQEAQNTFREIDKPMARVGENFHLRVGDR